MGFRLRKTEFRLNDRVKHPVWFPQPPSRPLQTAFPVQCAVAFPSVANVLSRHGKEQLEPCGNILGALYGKIPSSVVTSAVEHMEEMSWPFLPDTVLFSQVLCSELFKAVTAAVRFSADVSDGGDCVFPLCLNF